MTVVLLICIAVLLVAVLVLAAFLALQRPVGSDEFLDARAGDLERYGSNLENLTALYAEHLTRIAERKVDEMSLLLQGARGDRDRLLTAVLALTSPTAAVTVGRVDQSLARANEALTMHDFINETRETETQDGEGNPIIPVGLGG